MVANGKKRGPSADFKRPSIADLQVNGPRLHTYPNGLVVIQYAGTNKRGHAAFIAKKIGKLSQERAEAELEIFKVRLRANGDAPPANLPAVTPWSGARGGARVGAGRPRLPPDAMIPRDTTKAVLGLVATHLLNTLAHTVKLLQEADAD